MATTQQFSGEFIAKEAIAPTVNPPVKARRSNKSPSVKAKVVAKRANGETVTSIAKDLKISRPTVYAILDETNIDKMIESGELGACKLIHKSLDVIDKRLSTNSEEAAKFILSNTVFSDRYSKQGQRMKADTILQVAINNLIQPAKQSTKTLEVSVDNPTKTDKHE